MVRRLANNEREQICKELARNFPARSDKNHENLRIFDILAEFQTGDLRNISHKYNRWANLEAPSFHIYGI